MATYSLTYKGTLYKKGLFVLEKLNDDGMVFGEILLIIVCNNVVFFVVRENQAELLADLQVHAIAKEMDVVCIKADSLLDYVALPAYKLKGFSIIPLHHMPISDA